jgi:outer membrane protein assembly factor BamB
MKPKIFPLNLVLLACVSTTLCAQNNAWPQWRGPLGIGVAPTANPPLKWSETENVKWKVAIPGKGTSTPAVWNDKIFVLAAIPTGKKLEPATPPGGQAADAATQRRGRGEKPSEFYEFALLCLDRANGKTLWKKTAVEAVPHEGHHQDHSFASASPTTDGKFVYAYFGSRGLHCYDFEGNLKWSKDFGDMTTRNGFGEGASPALAKNAIIVVWDDENNDDFIVALDKTTGNELWRKPRNEGTVWTTPLIVDFKGQTQIIVNAKNKIRSYDLANGNEIWSCGGMTDNPIPSPVADEDTVYMVSGFRGAAAMAIQLGHTGDLTGNTNAIRWSYNKNMPYVPSPLLAGDLLYAVKDNGPVLSCFDKETGKIHYEAQRLEGIFGIYASPVAANDRVYVLGRDGTCLVLKKSPTLEILATNKLSDKTDASIAIVGKEMFIRGHQNLYCISEPAQTASR